MYLCIHLACLAFSLYPINVKTAKPIGSTFFVKTQGLRTVIRKKKFPGKNLFYWKTRKSLVLYFMYRIFTLGIITMFLS